MGAGATISEAFLPRPHWSALWNHVQHYRVSISEAFLPRPHWSGSHATTEERRELTFPRLFCLGPIEAEIEDLEEPFQSIFPRLFCLGPIEAYWYNIMEGVLNLFPRLFCLGPIEAPGRIYLVFNYTTISEAFLPRPHWSLDPCFNLSDMGYNFRGFFASAPLKQ